MTTLLIVALGTVLFVIGTVAAGSLLWMWRRQLSRRRTHARLSRGFMRSGACCGCGALRASRSGADTRIAGRSESRLDALQRRFVAGAITLDEYERGIDKLQQLAAPR